MKILLIDDHSLFRDGMDLLLSTMDKNVQLFKAACYEEALPLMEQHPDMDLILLDLGLPGLSDMDALNALRKNFPSVPVVVVSQNNSGSKVQQMLSMGAQGYIPKSTHSGVLIRAIKLVLSGGIYIPPEILTQYGAENGPTAPCNTQVENSCSACNPLTPRQLDVLQRIVYGQSNKEISVKLEMAEATVRAHVAAILKALNASNRTHAAHIAIKNGFVVVERKQ